MLAVFAIPAFWALLYSDYPRVGQVALVTTTQIFLAQFANMYHGSDEDSGILALAWERGLMMGVGIVLGLLVTWVCERRVQCAFICS